MATHKSAEKRNRQTVKRNQHNRNIKSEIKTLTKSVLAASKTEAPGLLRSLQSKLDKAKRKNILKANTVSRRMTRLQKVVRTK